MNLVRVIFNRDCAINEFFKSLYRSRLDNDHIHIFMSIKLNRKVEFNVVLNFRFILNLNFQQKVEGKGGLNYTVV